MRLNGVKTRLVIVRSFYRSCGCRVIVLSTDKWRQKITVLVSKKSRDFGKKLKPVFSKISDLVTQETQWTDTQNVLDTISYFLSQTVTFWGLCKCGAQPCHAIPTPSFPVSNCYFLRTSPTLRVWTACHAILTPSCNVTVSNDYFIRFCVCGKLERMSHPDTSG